MSEGSLRAGFRVAALEERTEGHLVRAIVDFRERICDIPEGDVLLRLDSILVTAARWTERLRLASGDLRPACST